MKFKHFVIFNLLFSFILTGQLHAQNHSDSASPVYEYVPELAELANLDIQVESKLEKLNMERVFSALNIAIKNVEHKHKHHMTIRNQDIEFIDWATHMLIEKYGSEDDILDKAQKAFYASLPVLTVPGNIPGEILALMVGGSLLLTVSFKEVSEGVNPYATTFNTHELSIVSDYMAGLMTAVSASTLIIVAATDAQLVEEMYRSCMKACDEGANNLFMECVKKCNKWNPIPSQRTN